MTVRFVFFVSLFLEIWAIWPLPYEINLNNEETFVISEISDDVFSDEDEMIPVRSSPSDKKYFKIHQLALNHNKRELGEKRDSVRNVTKIKEHNFDLDDAIPWEGGFVDKNGNFIQPDNENVYYLNEMAKSLIDSKIQQKRENEQREDKIDNYDYDSFRAEYSKGIEKAKNQKDTLNYTEVKEEESLKDAVKAVVEFKEPKNCTAEEKKGIGMAAIKCIVTDLKTPKSQNSIVNLIEKIARISLIWFCVYIVIAIPCWCTKGWCCCCCCCKICRPRQTIDEAKRFFTQNPVGTFYTGDGQKVEYPPTTYEVYTQKRLEKALFNL